MRTSAWNRHAVAALAAPVLLSAVAATPATATESAPPTLSFALPSTTDTDRRLPGTGSLIVGDYNGDGQSDVVVPTITRPGVLLVMLGDGVGGLQEPTLTALGPSLSVVSGATADLDGDSHLDLLASTVEDARAAITVFLGRGDGTFDVGQRITPAGTQVLDVALGDVDGDGEIDYAASVRPASSSVLQVARGRGDGTFRAATNYTPAISIYPDDLDLADVDNDGAPDLVYLQGCPVVRLNAGDGTFGAEICSGDSQGRGGGYTQALGDFDEDGFLDMASGDASGGHVNIALGDGAGRLLFHKAYDVKGNQVDSIAAADFTGDGHLDIVASADAYFSTPTRVIAELRGTGTGSMRRNGDYLTGGDQLAAIEFNGDGRVDLASSGLSGDTVSSVVNDGRGRFHAPLVYKGKPANVVSTIVRSADVNGDGRADLLTTSFGLVYVRLMGANGLLGDRIRSAGSGEIRSVALGDVNLDGKLDVVAGSFAPKNTFVMLGLGDGRFGRAKSFNNGSGAVVLGVAVGDVTGDGNPDVVSNAFASLSVAAGHGDGTFAAPVLSGVAGGNQPATLLADVTGDDVTDAVSIIRVGTADNARSNVIVNEGNGDGTFSVGQQLDVDTNTNEAAIVALGQDDTPDVALVGGGGSHSGRGGLFVLRNTGSTLAAATYYAGPGGGLTVADLNSDNTMDIATISAGVLRPFVSRGDGTLIADTDIPAGTTAYGLAAIAVDPSRVDLFELEGTNPEQVTQYRDTIR